MNVPTIGAVIISMIALIPSAPAQEFGPGNPFYSESKLPFQAPPFDKIKDDDLDLTLDTTLNLDELLADYAEYERLRGSGSGGSGPVQP